MVTIHATGGCMRRPEDVEIDLKRISFFRSTDEIGYSCKPGFLESVAVRPSLKISTPSLDQCPGLPIGPLAPKRDRIGRQTTRISTSPESASLSHNPGGYWAVGGTPHRTPLEFVGTLGDALGRVPTSIHKGRLQPKSVKIFQVRSRR